MEYHHLIDILAGLGILLLIAVYVILRDRERNRISKLMDNSVGEKYMQLMAAFMKRDGAKLIDMSTNKAEMKITSNDDTEENFLITQSEDEVTVYWSLSKGVSKLDREFKFSDNENQKEIMQAIAAGIAEAKKKA